MKSVDYWSIDIPGLTKLDAERLLELAKEHGLGEPGGYVIDPTTFMTISLDRISAATLRAALNLQSESIPEVDDYVARGLLESLEEWLNKASNQ